MHEKEVNVAREIQNDLQEYLVCGWMRRLFLRWIWFCKGETFTSIINDYERCLNDVIIFIVEQDKFIVMQKELLKSKDKQK